MATPPPLLSPVPPQGLKLADAAAYLGLSQVTVRRLVQRGEIKPVRAVRHLLFARSTLDQFLAGN